MRGGAAAERAGLDWGLEHNVPCGGWCPKGGKAEDGPIDAKYLNDTYLGLSKLPGLFSVPRHSGLRSLLASDKARFTPVTSKSLQ